jgi:hypothetical protein
MMQSRRRREGETATTRPAGILVLDRPPAPPRSLLQAYVWSRVRADGAALSRQPARPWALMVGPIGSIPVGRWAAVG